jgi:hypothetical protein
MSIQPAISLKQLISLAETKVQELNYSNESKRKIRTAWRKFERYTTEHGYTEFSEALASSFLKEKYDYPVLEAKRHLPHVNAVANAIRKLSDLKTHGRFLSRFKKELRFITPEFQSSIDAYVSYCRKRSISENSIWRHKKKLNDFFEHLLLHGITQPEMIDAIVISEYMRR